MRQISKIISYIVSESRNISSTTINGNTGIEKKINVAKDGYTPIAIGGWYITGTRASQVTIPNCRIVDEEAVIYFRNTNSSATAISGTITIVYKLAIRHLWKLLKTLITYRISVSAIFRLFPDS